MVRELIKDLNWQVSMEVLARLRATNPEIPMASTFDVFASLNQAHQWEDSFFESMGKYTNVQSYLNMNIFYRIEHFLLFLFLFFTAQFNDLPDNEGDHRADDSHTESLRMQGKSQLVRTFVIRLYCII